MTENILITGNGLLSKELQQNFNDSVYTTFFTNKTNQKNSFFLDVTKKNNLEKIFSEIKPDVIIHTAAITDLDWCEKNKDFAYKTNVDGTKYVKELAEKNGIKLIFISTDSVFDGENGNYKEEEETNSVNFYSKTKIDAEKIVSEYEKSLIVRGTFFGLKNGGNESFFSNLIKRLDNNEKIKVPKDKISNGLFVRDFSKIIHKMCEKNLIGIYHVGSINNKNNFEFAKTIADVGGYDNNLIEECIFNEIYETKKLTAKRPLNTTLDIKKISNEIKMQTVTEVIMSFYKNYNDTKNNQVRL